MEEILRKKLYLPHTVFSQVQGLSRNVNVLINTQIYIPVMGRVEVCNNTSRYSQGSQNCNIEYHESAVSLFCRHLGNIFGFLGKAVQCVCFQQGNKPSETSLSDMMQVTVMVHNCLEDGSTHMMFLAAVLFLRRVRFTHLF